MTWIAIAGLLLAVAALIAEVRRLRHVVTATIATVAQADQAAHIRHREYAARYNDCAKRINGLAGELGWSDNTALTQVIDPRESQRLRRLTQRLPPMG